ncbi:MAG TPA: hypothetical protein PLY86_04710 [bacterium]|nr:hypothetical protein [bacterium]
MQENAQSPHISRPCKAISIRFKAIVSWLFLLAILPILGYGREPAGPEKVNDGTSVTYPPSIFRCGAWNLLPVTRTVFLGRTGYQRSFSDGNIELLLPDLAEVKRPEIIVGAGRYESKLKTALPSGADYTIGPDEWGLNLQYDIFLMDAVYDGIRIVQQVRLRPSKPIHENFQVILPLIVQLPCRDRRVFAPRKNGVGEEKQIASERQKWFYYLTGSDLKRDVPALAIPMISEYSPSFPYRITLCADPYYSTLLEIGSTEQPGSFIWEYQAKDVPLSEPETRTFYTTINRGTHENAMQAFYESALRDIPPGPQWLHEIVMVDYDYLSDGGEGWFRDIDWLTEHIPQNDRRHICLALHGWYDLLGQYAFDAGTGTMKSEWKAFPNAPNVIDKFPNSKTVAMTPAEVNRRLQYAKDRGFRVVLYFADGMAICEDAKEFYKPEKILYSGGWQGPDTIGPTHIQNPLNPEVKDYFLSYMDALLKAFGNNTDGFVWDETFHVEPQHLGTQTFPGYASREMMYLCRDLARKVHDYRSDCAFLASDCIGVFGWNRKAPYALVVDGTYQDSHFRSEAWPYGLFPNYRNVLWSCSWNHVTHFSEMPDDVRKYDVPIPVTNGWGDDLGFSELPLEIAAKILNLFEERKGHVVQLKWLAPDDTE